MTDQQKRIIRRLNTCLIGYARRLREYQADPTAARLAKLQEKAAALMVWTRELKNNAKPESESEIYSRLETASVVWKNRAA